jgi:hypothetical protein
MSRSVSPRRRVELLLPRSAAANVEIALGTLRARVQPMLSRRVNSELPCDFTAFVARQRNIDVEQAQQLIGAWLIDYEPQCVKRSLETSKATPSDIEVRSHAAREPSARLYQGEATRS